MNSIHRLMLAQAVVAAACVPVIAADNPPSATASRVRFATWVNADVGLCLELDNLAEQWSVFAQSRLHDGIVGFPPVADWFAAHRQELALLNGEFERRTGASAPELGMKLLGRQAFFAIWPPANPLTDKPAALLLAEAMDGDLMRRSLEKLIAARRQAGRWRGRRSLNVGSDSYAIEVVVPDDEQSEFFITSIENVAVIATSEPLMRDVLERRAMPEDRGSLAAVPAFISAASQLPRGNVARLFINPRAWDAALEADLRRKPPGSEEAKSQAIIVAAWRATEYVSGSVQLTPQLDIELSWKWQTEALPEPVREVAASLAGRSTFLDNLPDDALVAFAGHVDLKRLVRSTIERTWRDEPQDGSQNQLPSVLAWALAAGLGPDWGGYLRVASGDKPPLGVELVAGVQTRPLEAGSDRPPFIESVEPVFHALLSAAVESVNRQSGTKLAKIHSTTNDGRRITTVTGLVPHRPQQELAYGVDQLGRFWVGTSAAAVEEASLMKAKLPGPCLAGLFDFGGLVTVNLAQWRKLTMAESREIDFLWEGRQLDSRGKERQFQSLLAFSHLADRLTLASRIDASTVRLSCILAADDE